MLTVFVLLAIAAFVIAVVNSMGRCPLWPGVLLLSVLELLRALPLGR
jgi:hypothetical protein